MEAGTFTDHGSNENRAVNPSPSGVTNGAAQGVLQPETKLISSQQFNRQGSGFGRNGSNSSASTQGEDEGAYWRITWDFFSKDPQAIILPDDVGVMDRLEGETRMLYFGKVNSFQSDRVTTIRIPLFIAMQLKSLCEEICAQHEVYGNYDHGKELLPFFNGDRRRAFHSPARRLSPAFWEEADLDFGSFKARFIFDVNAGEYRLRMLSPTSTPNLFGNWLGPQICLSVEAMKKFVSYITTVKYRRN